MAKEYKQEFSEADVARLFAGSAASERMDANNTLLMSRALNKMVEEVYTAQFSPLMADQILPTNATDRDVAEIRYMLRTSIGMALPVSNYGGDIPYADAEATEQLAKCVPFGIKYRVSVFDLINKAASGEDIDGSRAIAAREGSAMALDKFAAVGDSLFNNKGFLKDSNVPLVSPLTTNWTTASTQQQILDSLMAVAIAPSNNTKQSAVADTLVLPPTTYQLLATKRMDTNTEHTILSMFRTQAPWITNVHTWEYAETSSAASNKRVVAFKKSPSIVSQEIVKPFRVLPAQASGLHMEFNCYAITAGAVVKAPKGMAYMDIGT